MDSQLITSPFEPFSVDHLIVIGLTVFLCIFLPALVRRVQSESLTRAICWFIASTLVIVEVFDYGYSIIFDGWDYFLDEALPLHVCGVVLYLTAYMLITRKQLIYEIAYFWGFAGTVQGVLTPIVQEGFPSWHCFHFFWVHAGVVVGVAFATFGLRMRPRLKGLWITYAWSWVLLAVVGGLNVLLDTNYMFLCTPPTGQSPFYFLPWPWYIPFLGVVALVFFVLLWLPFCRDKSGGQ